MEKQLPKKWPEKLRALPLDACEPVDNQSSVYSSIRLIKQSDDKDHNFKEFTVRKDPVENSLFVWRTK